MAFDLTTRIDLVAGRVLASGSLEGSRRLCQLLLRSWTAHAAMAFSRDLDVWVEALAREIGLGTGETKKRIDECPAEVIENHRIDFGGVFDESWLPAREIFSRIRLEGVKSGLAFSNGPDYLVKLGEDTAPAPDFIIYHPEVYFTEFYIQNAPAIVIEATAALKDLDTYSALYAESGVRELWTIDVPTRRFSVFGNDAGRFSPVRSVSNVYESLSIPGLRVKTDNLWETGEPAVTFDGRGKPRTIPSDGAQWGDVLFRPRIRNEPADLSFEEFVSWAPESDFRWSDRLLIRSETGSRNVLGMLLQTLGADEAVKLLPAADWLIALKDRQNQNACQETLRGHLFREARKAAGFLRREWDFGEIFLFGDWIDKPTINKWTEIRIAVPDDFDGSAVNAALRGEVDEPVRIKNFGEMTKAENEVFSNHKLKL